jgi:hypothetical protein
VFVGCRDGFVFIKAADRVVSRSLGSRPVILTSISEGVVAASNSSVLFYQSKDSIKVRYMSLEDVTQMTTVKALTYNDKLVIAGQDITISYLDPLTPQKLSLQVLYQPQAQITRLIHVGQRLVLLVKDEGLSTLQDYDIVLGCVSASKELGFKADDLLLIDCGILVFGTEGTKGKVQILDSESLEVNWESTFPKVVTAAAFSNSTLVLAASEWVNSTQVFVLSTQPKLTKLYSFHVRNSISSLLLVNNLLYVGDSVESLILYELKPVKYVFMGMATKSKFTSGLCKLDGEVVELDKRGNLTVYTPTDGLKVVTYIQLAAANLRQGGRKVLHGNVQDIDIFRPIGETLLVTTWEGSIFQISKVSEDLQDKQTEVIIAGEAECSHVVKHFSGTTHFCNFVAEDLLDWRSNQ